MKTKRPNLLAWYLLICIVIALIVACVAYTVVADTRPQYTLSYPRAPFIARDADNLPSTLRPMCWGEDTGFCDTFPATPYLIYLVSDWKHDTLGGIWQVGNACYLQMFPQGSEHPYLADWVMCDDDETG